jgi:hypothetical protein
MDYPSDLSLSRRFMRISSPVSLPSRRGFLRKFMISFGGLFGLAALKQSAVAAVETPEPPAAEPAKQGYRETEHVRAYYDAARF